MQMQQCQNGHFYDQSIHKECPYCTGGSIVGATIGLTQWQTDAGTAGKSDDSGKTQRSFTSVVQDNNRTVPVIKKMLGIDPVVGWLICVEGQEKGKDYRIHSDNNFIGRDPKMDICISNDETISRENHALVSYDAREKKFFFSPGDGRSIVRLNGKAIFQSVEIKNYDVVEIGNTKLVFVALCGEEFSWME